MRIGVLTFHRSYNYGAFMQCFSLVTRLKKEFPDSEVEVIDYTAKKAMDFYQNELGMIKDPETREKYRERNNAFVNLQNSLPLSDFKIVSYDTDEIIKKLNDIYDVVIVGSDAVWNWNVRGFPNPYFLKDFSGIKFSYAASVHGMNYQNMTEGQKEYLKVAFADFNYIGVRDSTTEQMVSFCNPEITPYHNCDPTMFLDLNTVPCDIEKLKNKLVERGVDFSKPLIGVMAESVIGKEIKNHYGDSVQMIGLYKPNKYVDVFLHDLTPFEWAHVFSFFKVTLTHFFHGTMLSLVNSVPVIPIEFANEFSRLNITKIKDLIGRMDLNEWRHEVTHKHYKLKKLLTLLGFNPNAKLWKNVCKQIDLCLKDDYSELIKEKVSKEKQSSDTFFNALKEYVK